MQDGPGDVPARTQSRERTYAAPDAAPEFRLVNRNPAKACFAAAPRCPGDPVSGLPGSFLYRLRCGCRGTFCQTQHPLFLSADVQDCLIVASASHTTPGTAARCVRPTASPVLPPARQRP